MVYSLGGVSSGFIFKKFRFLISEAALEDFRHFWSVFEIAKMLLLEMMIFSSIFHTFPHWLGYWQFSSESVSRAFPRKTKNIHFKVRARFFFKGIVIRRLTVTICFLLYNFCWRNATLGDKMVTYLGASCTKTKIAKADTRAVSVAKIPTTTRIIVTSLLVWCIGSHGWVQLSKPPKFQSGYIDLKYTLDIFLRKVEIKNCLCQGSNPGPFTYRCSTGHCISRCIRSPPVSSMFHRSVPGGSSSVCIWIGMHGCSESFLGNLSHENSSGSSIPNDSISDAHSVITFLVFSHALFSKNC